MTKTLSLCFEFGPLEFICHLACLREAASAEAGACNLVLLLRTQIFVAILRTILFTRDYQG
jgi:hypothetical protein